MLGFSPISSTPICALPAGFIGVTVIVGQSVVEARFSNPLADLVSDPKKQLVISAEITEVPIYTATHDFITRSSDVIPNQAYLGTLDSSVQIRRSIVGGDGFSSLSENITELTLINRDGEYDTVSDVANVNGKEIIMRVGEVASGVVIPLAEFETLAILIGDRWRISRENVVIETHDIAAKLDVPVQTSTYLGTGELEGGPDLAGKRRPRGFGYLRANTLGRGGNVTPTPVIAVEGLFQVNDGPVDEIVTVYDGGVGLEFNGDYATVDLLRAAVAPGGTILPGQWGSCNAAGYFAIGSLAISQITCDFHGDSSLTGYVETTADIIKRILLTSTDVGEDNFDNATFEILNDVQSAPIAYYLDSNSSETVAETIKKLMGGIGGWFGLTILGRARVQRLEAPVGISSEVYDLSSGSMIDVDRVDLPRNFDPPPRRCRVIYARNWTIQTTIFGVVSLNDPDRAAYLGQPYLLASTSEDEANAVLANYPFAPDPEPRESYFVNQVHAQSEAQRLHVLYNSGYKMWRFTIKNALLLHEIGEEVNIADSSIVPRLQLGSGRYVRIVDSVDDLETLSTEHIGFG